VVGAKVEMDPTGKSEVQATGAAVGSVLSLSSLRSSRHSGSSGSSRHLEGRDFSAEESLGKLGLESMGKLGLESMGKLGLESMGKLGLEYIIIWLITGGQNWILFGSS
jgi:hypothetical protein